MSDRIHTCMAMYRANSKAAESLRPAFMGLPKKLMQCCTTKAMKRSGEVVDSEYRSISSRPRLRLLKRVSLVDSSPPWALSGHAVIMVPIKRQCIITWAGGVAARESIFHSHSWGTMSSLLVSTQGSSSRNSAWLQSSAEIKRLSFRSAVS